MSYFEFLREAELLNATGIPLLLLQARSIEMHCTWNAMSKEGEGGDPDLAYPTRSPSAHS